MKLTCRKLVVMKMKLVGSHANPFGLVKKKEYTLLPCMKLTSLSNFSTLELCV